MFYLQASCFFHLQNLFPFEFLKADLYNEVTCKNTEALVIFLLVIKMGSLEVFQQGVYKPPRSGQ